MNNILFILIGVVAAVIILIILIAVIISIVKSNQTKEPEASILDVDTLGVPSTSEANEFSYGYEKEETIVMNPVDEETEDNKKTNEEQ